MPLDHQARHQTVHPYFSSSANRERVDDRAERELDVFRLIARGLSNAEIGEELYIGETTVKTHSAHMIRKQYPRDRVLAVALAYEPGLLDAGDTR